jgi:hypothetical protein
MDSNFWFRERKYVPGKTSPARATRLTELDLPLGWAQQHALFAS